MTGPAQGQQQRLVILGAGTGGTLAANRLRKKYKDDRLRIDVVDQDNRHVYQPGLLFVPFGLAEPDEIVRKRDRQLKKGIHYHQCPIESVDIEANSVALQNGTTLEYDVLLIATGARLLPEETEGLTGPGWHETVHTFYDMEGATALAEALDDFESGHIVINVIDMPIKCPVAPLEFAFLADWYFTDKGVRDDVRITYVTPLDGAFTKPTASATLGSLLDDKHVELVTEFNTGEVDGENGKLISWDGREVDFDLAVVIPLHGGAASATNWGSSPPTTPRCSRR
jgi:sulfide:quinone oxidoreductase